MDFIQIEVENKVALVTIVRPPANALSKLLIKELDETFSFIEDEPDIHVIVVCGEGRFFAAGADIIEFVKVESGEAFTEIAKATQSFFNRIEQGSKPVIAAIHGAALGGGLELALACHIRLATEDAKLGLPELNLGIIPGFGGTQRLPRLIGKAKALELMLTGEPVSGKEALDIGLINAIHSKENLIDEAKILALKIAEKSELTTRMVLELMKYQETNLKEGLNQEALLFGQAFESENGKEGIQAFIEKRKPMFK
ncbi:enoyl-CoA hydratase [Bacillus solitudinis]|uniref:enoyl-CoA hydratase n=1 Tax=Bacillus solitudinis TaxID=2014074 RepID=UPI000C23548C|nr:enoyl-CoA hydratase [Bacillus solitudinis]